MRSRLRRWSASILNPAMWVLLIVGFASLGFLAKNNLSWRNGISGYLPAIDNIQRATLDLSVAQLWLEEILMGDMKLTIDQVRSRLVDAEKAITDCIEGRSSIADLPVSRPAAETVVADLIALKSAIQDLRKLTDQSWELRNKAAVGSLLDEPFENLFRDIISRTNILTSELHLLLSADISRRQREFYALVSLWLVTIIGAIGIIMATAKRRREAEKGAVHLNSLLRAIRNVNQLIARETDRDRLIKEACQNLVEARGYDSAWMVLVDESGRYLNGAEAGLGLAFLPLLQKFEGREYPSCFRKSMADSSGTVFSDRMTSCGDCPLSSRHAGLGAWSIRLEHAGEIYGLLTITIPAENLKDREELDLLKEVAGDISLALHNLELEQKRLKAEHKTKISEAHYRAMFENMNTAVAVYEAVDDGEDFIFKEFNHAAEKIEKVNGDDLIGKSVLKVFPGVKEFGIFDVFKRVWRTGKSEHHPISIYKDNRIAGWRENFVYKLPSGEIVALYEDVTERVRVEEAIRISEANYRTIFNSANDAIMILDLHTGEILDGSSKVIEMTGYTLEEMKKMNLDSLTIDRAPYTIHDGWKLINKAAEDESQIFEWLAKGKQGNEFWAEVNLKKARIADRDIIIAAVRDIGARKKAESALKQSEERYRQLYENAQAGLFRIRISDSRVIECNDKFAQAFGFLHKSQVIGLSAIDFYVDARDREIFYAKLREAGKIEHVEMPFKRKDGTPVWLRASVRIFPEDDFIEGVAIDVTDEKQARHALEAESERLAVTLRSIGDAVITTDVSGHIVLFNKVAEHLTGWTEIEAVGRPISEIFKVINELTRKSCPNPAREALKTGRIVNLADGAVLIAKDGTERFIADSGAPIIDKSGTLLGAVLVFRDVTKARQLQEFAERARRLETAGMVAGQVAHDFNNLLGPIIAYPGFIRQDLPANHPTIRYLDDMEKAAEQMADINQQLLALGRRGHYSLEPLNLNELVQQVLRQIPPQGKNQVIETDLDPGLMNVKGGSSQISRVISNLINNARDAVRDVGSIMIRTENHYADRPTGRYGNIPRGEYAKMSISDTGSGIAAEILPKIFDPFFTTKTTDRRRGSGLGLSVVDAVIKDHDGYIDIESTPGTGTTFNIYLPITRETIETPEPDEEIRGGNETILVIDDDSTQREVTINLLEKLGYLATAVESGEQACAYLKGQPADLLILDMVMPESIDGAETFRRILEISPEQKAIIVSGYAESDRVELATRLGAGAFLRKPLTLKSIASAVRKELDRPT